MKKRILAVLISICLFIGLSPIIALAADTELNISDGSIDINTSGSYTIIQTDSGKTENQITIKSDVTAGVTICNLNIEAENGPAILVEAGAKLNLTLVGVNLLTGAERFAAICVAPAYNEYDDYDPDASAELTIDGSGSLIAQGGKGGAGIGGSENSDGGYIYINGGTITATGGELGAGIGGGTNSDGGYIYITGGTITAQGGIPDGAMGAAGIGGGDNGSVHKIEITGGNVKATASGGAAGIGGGTNTSYGFQHGDMNGNRDKFGIISISGENTVVEAIGGSAQGSSGMFGGAGIGSGYPVGNNARSVAYNISITGGATVNAYGGYHAQAIGYGYRPSGSSYYTGYGIYLELDDSITLWAQNQDCFQPALVAETQYDTDPIQYKSKIGTKLICSMAESANSYTELPGEAVEEEEWTLADGVLTVGSMEVRSGLVDDTLGNWAVLLAAPVPQHMISYNLNGGDANGGDYSDDTINQGEAVTVKDAPVRSGYVFGGWSDGEKIWQPGDRLTALDDVTLTAQWYAIGGEIINRYILHYDTNGGTAYEDEQYMQNTVVELHRAPIREGYRFIGWYGDKELSSPVTSVKMTSDKIVYADWLAATIPEMLNGKDHFAYVLGYTDGKVRPLENISRAETAAIFLRLLNSDIRDENLTYTNPFTDVPDGMWCNTAISTLVKLGVIKGRTAESFAPSAAITRGEFAVICARFDISLTYGASGFIDISGHWSEDEINRVAAMGWVQGDEDGRFNPDAPITRAEAMTIINRMLCRIPENEQDLLDGMNVWTDNPSGTWYYLAVQEASNSHDFTHKGEIYEQWTALKEDPDWKKYE